MSTKKLPWFRMYTDFLNDPKMIALAFEDQRHFIGVLALKSDGLLDDVCEENLLNRIVAQRLWIDHGIIRDVKKRLIDAGLIDANWQPLAWSKRQFASDRDSTAAERKRRERAAKSAAKNGVTDTSRVTSRTRHENVTRLDTDTDTDTEEETATVGEVVGGKPTPDALPPAPPAPKAAASVAAKAQGATRLPDGWVLPKAWGEWALAERPDFTADDVLREAECFADHWHAKAGADARKIDWQATWRNWVRRAHGTPSARPASRIAAGINPQEPVETYAQRAARQRVEEIAPMAARRAPGAAGSFEAAQRFMAGGAVIDVAPKGTTPRIGTQGVQ